MKDNIIFNEIDVKKVSNKPEATTNALIGGMFCVGLLCAVGGAGAGCGAGCIGAGCIGGSGGAACGALC